MTIALKKYLYLLLAVLLLSCGEQKNIDNNSADDLTNIPSDGYIVGLKYYVYKGKDKYWDLIADSAEMFEVKNYSIADSIYVKFYKGDTVSSILTAKEGYANLKNSNLSARHNVIVRSMTGSVLYTEKIVWDNARQKITSDTYVKIIRKRDTLTGIGMESDANLEKLVIKNNIKVIQHY